MPIYFRVGVFNFLDENCDADNHRIAAEFSYTGAVTDVHFRLLAISYEAPLFARIHSESDHLCALGSVRSRVDQVLDFAGLWGFVRVPSASPRVARVYLNRGGNCRVLSETKLPVRQIQQSHSRGEASC